MHTQQDNLTRRKKRQQMFLRRRLLLLAGALLLLVGLVQFIALGASLVGGFLAQSTPEATIDPAISKKFAIDSPKANESGIEPLRALLGQYPALDAVVNAPQDYPESAIQLFLRNQETLDFLLAYPSLGEQSGAIDISGELRGGELPLFLQWDARWGYQRYGADLLAVTGCGPTTLSIVATGLTGNASYHPAFVARMSEEAGYYVSGVGTSWDLMNTGCEKLGLRSEVLPLDYSQLYDCISSGKPVICSMGPGDFTDKGHFIVISEALGDRKFKVMDPNSRENSKKEWSYDTLQGQIKNLWAFSRT